MDPVSVVGLVATCTSLVGTIIKTQSALSELHGKIKTSEIIISSLASQLRALEASASELESFLKCRAPFLNRRDKFCTALEQSLTSTASIVDLLWDEVSDASSAIDEGRGLTRWRRAKHVWNEGTITPLKDALRDQVQAMQLLLSVSTMTNEVDQEATLDDAESIAIFKRARDDYSSLMWLRDADSTASIMSRESDTMSRLSMVFTFDHEVLSSGPYRKAVMASWKQIRRGRQQGASAQAPPVSSRVDRISLPLRDDVNYPMISRLGGVGTLVGVVRWKFKAEREDELSCRTGEVLIPVAISTPEWVVAKPIARVAGLGLVPISYLSVVLPNGKTCDSDEEAIKELREAGVLDVRDWKKQLSKVAGNNIPLN